MKYVNSGSKAMLVLTVAMTVAFSQAGNATAAEQGKRKKTVESLEQTLKILPASEGKIISANTMNMVSASDEDATGSEHILLDINGSMQFQYIKVNADPQINEMNIRRFNLSVIAQVNEKVSLIVEPEYGKSMPATRDAYATFDISGTPVNLKNSGAYAGSLVIFAGNHRVPFSAEALQNDINLRFVERNLTSQISPDRMVGLSFVRAMLDKKLTVQVGVWNSNLNSKAEANLINNRLGDNQIFAPITGTTTGSTIAIKAIRVGYSTAGRANFYDRSKGFSEDENFKGETNMGYGFSYYNSSVATTGAAATAALTGFNGARAYEADMSIRIGKLSAEIEYANRSLDWWQYNPATLSVAVNSVQTSYSVQASYLVMENMSVALRKESFSYDGSGQVLKGAYGQDKDDWTTVGVNYYSKDLNTKIQGNYILKNESMPVGAVEPSNNTLLIQSTTYF